jgi:hypothetical protein
MKKKLAFGLFAVVALIGLASGCSLLGLNKNFKAGQKLSGHYEANKANDKGDKFWKEHYVFKDDGTYQNIGGDSGMESGTYRIDGETIAFKSGRKTTTHKIIATSGDANKENPKEIKMDAEYYKLTSEAYDGASPEPPLKEEYEKFLPPTVGQYKSFSESTKDRTSISKSSDDGRPWIEYGIGLFARHLDSAGNPTGTVDDQISVAVEKYASESEAQAELNKRVKAAVPIAEYDQRVNLGKCNSESENTHPPEQFIKQIPLKSGGNAFYIAEGKQYDSDCKKINGGSEYITWSQGVYILQLEIHVDQNLLPYSKKGEPLVSDYLQAIGQK